MSDRTALFALFGALFKGEVSEALSQAKTIYYTGIEPIEIVDQLMQLVHAISTIKTIGISSNYFASENETEKLRQWADMTSIPVATRFWQCLLKGREEMLHADNSFIHLEMLCIRICYIADLPTLSEITANPVPTKQKSLLDFSKPKADIFRQIVQLFLAKKEMMLHHYLKNDVRLVDVQECKLTVYLSPEVPKDMPAKIASLLSTWLGETWSVLISTEEGKADPTIDAQITEAIKDKKSLIANELLVKKTLNTFPGSKIREVIVERDINVLS
jgi:DNA polymerase-3 subunit gamma/tau